MLTNNIDKACMLMNNIDKVCMLMNNIDNVDNPRKRDTLQYPFLLPT